MRRKKKKKEPPPGFLRPLAPQHWPDPTTTTKTAHGPQRNKWAAGFGDHNPHIPLKKTHRAKLARPQQQQAPHHDNRQHQQLARLETKFPYSRQPPPIQTGPSSPQRRLKPWETIQKKIWPNSFLYALCQCLPITHPRAITPLTPVLSHIPTSCERILSLPSPFSLGKNTTPTKRGALHSTQAPPSVSAAPADYFHNTTMSCLPIATQLSHIMPPDPIFDRAFLSPIRFFHRPLPSNNHLSPSSDPTTPQTLNFSTPKSWTHTNTTNNASTKTIPSLPPRPLPRPPNSHLYIYIEYHWIGLQLHQGNQFSQCVEHRWAQFIVCCL